MISFGFEDGFVDDSFKDDFKGFGGTAFRGLTDIIGRIETFFLAGTKAGAEAKAEAGTRGTETEAGVILAAETFGTVGVVGTVGIEAKVILAVGIIGTVETTGTEAGVALGMEAFPSCARLNKNSR
jgi:hypothetical protein